MLRPGSLQVALSLGSESAAPADCVHLESFSDFQSPSSSSSSSLAHKQHFPEQQKTHKFCVRSAFYNYEVLIKFFYFDCQTFDPECIQFSGGAAYIKNAFYGKKINL